MDVLNLLRILRFPPSKRYNHLRRIDTNSKSIFISWSVRFIYLFIIREKFFLLSFELAKREKKRLKLPRLIVDIQFLFACRGIKLEEKKYICLIIIASIRIKMKFIFSFLFNKDIQNVNFFFTKRMSLYVWKASSHYCYYYYSVSPSGKRISIFDRKIEDPPPEIFHHFPFDLRAGTVAAHPEDSLRCRGRSIHPVLDPRLRIPRQENFHPTGLVCHLCPLIEDRSKRYP